MTYGCWLVVCFCEMGLDHALSLEAASEHCCVQVLYMRHMRVTPMALHPNHVCGLDVVANLLAVVCGIMGEKETQ